MHVIAAQAVAFHEAMLPEFVAYQQAVVDNARILAQELQRLGLRLVSGGTDTHLILVDLTPIGISGRQAEAVLESVGIVVNKNNIPFDPRPPQIASGIRLGTPAISTRGCGTEEMKHIAALIVKTLTCNGDLSTFKKLRGQVREICRHFPIPEGMVMLEVLSSPCYNQG